MPFHTLKFENCPLYGAIKTTSKSKSQVVKKLQQMARAVASKLQLTQGGAYLSRATAISAIPSHFSLRVSTIDLRQQFKSLTQIKFKKAPSCPTFMEIRYALNFQQLNSWLHWSHKNLLQRRNFPPPSFLSRLSHISYLVSSKKLFLFISFWKFILKFGNSM